MKKQELEQLLILHGTDPAHWPQNMRAPMQTCLQSSAEFARLYEKTARMESEMRRCFPAPDAQGLAARIIAATPMAQSVLQSPGFGMLARTALAAGCAFALIAGGSVGYFMDGGAADDSLSRLTATALYGIRILI